jgi:hypothetical protein
METPPKKKSRKTKNQRATEKSIAQVWADLNRGHDKVGEIIKETTRISKLQGGLMRNFRAAIPLKSKRLTKSRGRAKPRSRWQVLVMEHGVKNAKIFYDAEGGGSSVDALRTKAILKRTQKRRLKKYRSRPRL